MSSFSINTKIYFGKKSTEEVSNYLNFLELKKIQFIIDDSLKESAPLLILIDQYKQYGNQINTPIYIDAKKEPTYDYLDTVVDLFRGYDFNVIIGIGGGTILDLAKGIGLLLKNPGKAIDYRGMDLVSNKGVPVISYPTTAGTGAEVTHTASFIDTDSKTKLGINGRYVAPLCGVLYPELTFSCPDRITISAGLDAMLHALEAVTAKTATKISSMFGCKAFSLLYKSFPTVLSEPRNYEAREEMLLGSYYAGIAMMNAGGGPASGISYPLGVHYGVPHGIAGGIFLHHVIKYNVSKGYRGYNEIYNNLYDADSTLNEEQKTLEFVKSLQKLYQEIGAPKKLHSSGFENIDIELITMLTMEQRVANLELNPVPFGRKEVKELLQVVA